MKEENSTRPHAGGVRKRENETDGIE